MFVNHFRLRLLFVCDNTTKQNKSEAKRKKEKKKQ